MKKRNYFVYLLSVILFVQISGCQQPNQKKTDMEQKVDSLLALMTIEEKIGQMTLFTSDWDVTGPTMRLGYKEDIKNGKVGAIFNAFGVKYLRELQQLALEDNRLQIPLMFGYDVIHGYKTIFPLPLAQAASWDLKLIEASEHIAAVEASAEGLHWTFAPMIDIARDPRWGRICEGAGEDTYLGSLIAAARVRGFQGKDLADNNTVVACAKHYAAYGAALAGRDYNTVDISDRTLREIYLPPFKAALDEGVGTFMTSFNELDGVPASGSKYLLRDILKGDWGFQGFVVTDYTSIEEMVDHGIVADNKEAGELALNAGVDMDMQSAIFNDYTLTSFNEGKVKIEDIDDAVRRILSIKYKLGLFDDPFKYCDEERENTLVMHPDHLNFAREFAAKSIVLLKNEGEILPLSKNTKNIALIGPLADSKTDMIGSWSAAGDYMKSTTVLEGMKAKLPGTNIFYAKGCDVLGTDKSGFSEALAVAGKSDVIVLAIGESRDLSGEATSRTSINIPGVQEELFAELNKLGKPIVVVLMNGRPLDLTWLNEQAPAILETWFLGTKAGDAIADVLFGDYNPSGKLTVTFPRNLGQVPIFYNTKNTGRPITEDKWTSKYLDVENTPLFPFGYGLSYSSFQYSDIKLSQNTISPSEILTVSVDVKNTGKYAGEEVVQLYLRDLVGSVTRPVKELKGFEKIFLEPGQTKTVKFEIGADKLKFLDINMKMVAEPGDFEVFVGTNSRDVNSARFSLVE
ncbi:MAG: glycoside hydrolase family 3 C-terminal domain-containing protein [Bacteroidales bacterium]|nr:glycoside hydrolase family 3 C-terminal domain-containing protein [Bacteroidales bacterium]